MKIPLVEGEMCRRQPFAAPMQLMVNRAFRSRYLSGWPSVIGLHLTTGTNTVKAGTIVGIVADARDHGIARAPAPLVYLCFSAANPTPRFLVRTRADPEELAYAVRLKLKRTRTPALRLRHCIARGSNRRGIRGEPLADNGAGLCRRHGAHARQRRPLRDVKLCRRLRRREIGLRLTLGAVRQTIVRQFLVPALRVAVVAVVTGLVLSSVFTRLLEGMLYGVSPADPFVFATVAAFVLVVVTLAALIPATRAALVEPIEVLREG